MNPRTKTYSTTKHVASFVGFAPVENAAVVIIVVIDEPSGAYHGGDVAAPVFREIAEQILPDLGIAPNTKLKLESDQADHAASVMQSSEGVKAQQEKTRVDNARKATLPSVSTRDGKGGEVVYAVASSKGVLMPDLRGQSVRDVARACAQLGLQVEARGDGHVIRQSPAPGAEVGSGQVVSVDFARDN